MYLVYIDKENDGCYDDYVHSREMAGVYDSLSEAREAIYRRWMKDVSYSVMMNAVKDYIYHYSGSFIVQPLDEETPMSFRWVYEKGDFDWDRWTCNAVIEEIELNKDLF